MEDGGPSVTARWVAAHRLGFARVATDYGDPAADEALAADVAAGRAAPANRMHDYLAARTSFFDRTVVSALDRGVGKVAVGAAGYDGRAFRYAKPGVRWFEVDHPATQRDKLERLERLERLEEPGSSGSASTRPTCGSWRPTSPATRVRRRLRAAGLDPDAPSLFLLEEVAVYLEPAVLEDVLRQFRQVAAPGSSLAISVPCPGRAATPPRPLPGHGGRARGRPARSTFEPAEAEALLARTGWPLAAGASDGQPTAAGRDRLRAVRACSWPASAARTGPPQPSQRPRRPNRPKGITAPCPYRPCCPRRWSRSRSVSTTRPNTARTASPATGLPARATAPGAVAGIAGHVGELHAVRHGRAHHRRRPRSPRPHRDQPGRHAPVGLYHHRRHRQEGSQRPPGRNAVLRATAAGLRAREIWRPLPGFIEQRWRERLGADQLRPLQIPSPPWSARLDRGLPDCLPILGAALLSQGPDRRLPPRSDGTAPEALPLSRAALARPHFTPGVTGALRASLEPLAAGRPPVLSGGLEPYPDNWRASVRRPATLPHFPMVLHRGGYPDGS